MSRDEILEVNPEAILYDGLDEAIIGYAERPSMPPVAAYDVEKIIDILAKDIQDSDVEMHDYEYDNKMTIEDVKRQMAYEFYDYNILNGWLGENMPVFITTNLG